MARIGFLSAAAFILAILTLTTPGDSPPARAVSTIDQVSIDMGGSGTNVGVNDNGVPAVVDADFSGAVDSETGAQCTGAGIGVDDDADTVVDDGCVVTLSAQETCAKITNDNTLNSDEDTTQFGRPPTGASTSDKVFFDVTVGQQPGSGPGTPGGIPSDRPITQANVRINWSPDVLNVNPVGGGGDPAAASINSDFLMAAAGSYAPSTPVSIITQTGNVLITRGDGGPTETGAGVLLRVGLEGVAAGLADLTLTDVDIRDNTNTPISVNTVNNAKVAVDIPCPLPPADAVMQSVSLSFRDAVTPATVIASIGVSQNFIVRVSGTAINNGPNPADIQLELGLTVPGDCSAAPIGTQTEAFANVPSTETRTSTRDWTVSCGDPSTHDFTASASVSITGLANESNASNNGPITSPGSIPVLGQADPAVTGVSVSAPVSGATGVPFNVTVTATMQHNSGVSPVTVDVVFDLTVPAGCNRVPNNTQTSTGVSVPSGPPAQTQQTWSVTCSTTGLKSFTGSASLTLNQLHVSDSDANNNSGQGQGSTDMSASTADVKVSSVVVTSPPTVDLGDNFPVTVNTTLHNNGPYFPPNVDTTVTLNLPADCFTPVTTVVFQNASLGPSVDAMLPQLTFFVACIDHSFHDITATATAVIDDPLAVDPNLSNNTLTSANSTTAVIRTSDLKVNSVAVGAPASADTGVPFNVTVDATLHDNGPDPAPATATVTLNMPPDCSASPNPKNVALSLAVSTSTAMPTQTFSVTCTNRSSHDFSATVDLAGPLHVNDPSPGDNSASSGSPVTVPVFDVSDLRVINVMVSGPAQGTVNTAFNVNATVNVANDGPYGPTNADVTATLSLPLDCTTTSSNPQTVQDMNVFTGFPAPANASWSVTCTNQSFHDFSASGSVVIDQLHVRDPDGADNSGQSPNTTIPIYAMADGKIQSAVVVNPPTFVAANTNVNITVRKTLHNNGPFSPATFNLSKSTVVPPGCTATPPALSAHVLATSATITVDEVWVVNCAAGGPYTFTFNNTLTVTGQHVSDPTSGNNSSSTNLTIVVDTDGDGVPDATEAACGSNPNNGSSIPERIDGSRAGVSDDGDLAIDEALPAGSGPYDCDGDGWTGNEEQYIYSAANTVRDQDRCGVGTGSGPDSSNNGWPADLDHNNSLGGGDLNSFLFPERPVDDGHGTFNKFGHVASDGPDVKRWDLDTYGGIAGGDLNALNPGVIAPTARPPMLAGQPAFGQSCPP